MTQELDDLLTDIPDDQEMAELTKPPVSAKAKKQAEARRKHEEKIKKQEELKKSDAPEVARQATIPQAAMSLEAIKQSLKDSIVTIGLPAPSRHLSIAVTALEDAVFRIDAELRSRR